MLRALILALGASLATQAAPVNITILVPTKADIIGALAKRYSDNSGGAVNVRVVDFGWGGQLNALFEAADNDGVVRIPDPQFPDDKTKGERVNADLAWVGSTWMGGLVLNYRAFEPLDPYFAEWATERAAGQIEVDFAPRTDFDYKITLNGETSWYGIPHSLDTRIFFYRKDMYREVLGHDREPATLDELENNARRIKSFYAAQGRNVSGMAVSTLTPHGPTLQDFVTYYLGYGASVAKSASGGCAYATPQFKEAFEKHSRVHAGPNAVQYQTNATMEILMDSFREGTVAQGIFGAWAYWGFINSKPEFTGAETYLSNVGMVAPPAGPARRATFMGGSGFSLFAASKQKKAAFDFLKFIMEPSSAEYATFLGDDVPSFNSLLDVIRFGSGLGNIPSTAMLRALPFAYPQTFPDKDYAAPFTDVENENVIQTMINNVHNGFMTLDEAISWGCKRTDEVLAEALRKRDAKFPPEVAAVLIVSDKKVLGAALGAAAAALVLIAIGVFIWYRRSKGAHRDIVAKYQEQTDELLADRKAATIPFADIEFGPKIGSGAFGDVYRGEVHGTAVAIKKLRVRDEKVAENMRAEAVVIARLRHPNVCLFMGTSTDPKDGSLCLVTEFLEHGSVYDMIHNSDVSMDITLVATFLKGAALGCAYLHSRDPPLLHKDIKSLNILADANLVPKICDFGLSGHTKAGGVLTAADLANAARGGSSGAIKSLASSNSKVSAGSTAVEGAPPGSLYWMAPEVARGGDYTAAADVYSFGITMWELVTRRIPYDGEPPFAVIQQVLNNGRRPEIPTTIPSQLADLLRECWSENPLSRPTFTAIYQRLGAIFGSATGTMSRDVSAASAPTGEVTLVFTDVRGSTSLWEACSSAMRIALGLHNACARSLIREHGGYEVKTEGDSFMVAFAKPLSAVQWACALQEQLARIDWPAELLAQEDAAREAIAGKVVYSGLRVRIGMHTSKVQAQIDAGTRRMDYFGRGVNKSARVSNKAQGGQVILTEETLSALGGAGQLSALGISVLDLGSVHLKGISEPVNLFQATPAALAARTFAPIDNIGGGASSMGTPTKYGTRRPPLRPLGSESGTNVIPGSGMLTTGSLDSRDNESDSAFQFSAALGRIQSLVKKQGWTINYADLSLGSVIGQGSFGQVYEARYRGQRVAVKALLAHRLSETHTLHFYEEMTILSLLRHPNIVMFVGATMTPPSIVTEFASNGSLSQVLATNAATKALGVAEKVSIAKQVASAMVYLSSATPPILHRDLKSSNVLLMEGNVAKVADFGLSVARAASSTMSTVGTAGFMAPEVLSGDSYSSSADVFAFGVLLFELIGEVAPFRGLGSIQVGQAVLKGERSKLPMTVESKQEYAPLIKLMKDCWAQNPEERPSFPEVYERLSGMSKV